MQNRLTKESLLYGIGHISSRLITFLLLPLFTNILSPREYGIVALVYTFIAFLTVILHFGLDASLLRHYKPAQKTEKNKYLPISHILYSTTHENKKTSESKFSDNQAKKELLFEEKSWCCGTFKNTGFSILKCFCIC